MTIAETAPAADRELVLTRIIDAPREKLFMAWTDAELLKQWFAPLPYTTPVAELDVATLHATVSAIHLALLRLPPLAWRQFLRCRSGARALAREPGIHNPGRLVSCTMSTSWQAGNMGHSTSG